MPEACLDSFHRLKEEAAAEELLAQMELQQDLAELHDTEQCAELRQKFALLYQQCIGVHPDHRADLQLMLEMVVSGEQGCVDQIVSELGAEPN